MENKEYQIMSELELNHWWDNNLHHLIEETLEKEAIKLKRSLSIFDIGCGTGGLIYRLKNKSYLSKILATDPHPLARKFAKKRGIKVKNFSIENLSEINENFDVVLCIDVLYHKNVNPLKAIKNLFNLLIPGGMVLINVAAMPSLKRNHSERVMEERRFTLNQIKNLLESEGFEIKNIFYWNSFLMPILWVISRWQNIFTNSLIFPNDGESSLKTTNFIVDFFLNKVLFLKINLEMFFLLAFGSSLFVCAFRPKCRLNY